MTEKGKKRFILTIPDVFNYSEFKYEENNEPKFPWPVEKDKSVLEQAKKHFPGFQNFNLIADNESGVDGDDCYGGPPKIYIKKEDIEKITVSVEREKDLEGLKLKVENLEKELKKAQNKFDDKDEAFYGLEITFEKNLKVIDKLEKKLQKADNVNWKLMYEDTVESEIFDAEDIDPQESFETSHEVESEIFDTEDINPQEKFQMPDEPDDEIISEEDKDSINPDDEKIDSEEEKEEIKTSLFKTSLWSEDKDSIITTIVENTCEKLDLENKDLSTPKKKAFDERLEKPNEFLYRFTETKDPWTDDDEKKWEKKIEFYKKNKFMWPRWGLFSSDFPNRNGISCWRKNSLSESPLTGLPQRVSGRKRKRKVDSQATLEDTKRMKLNDGKIFFCVKCSCNLSGIHPNFYSECTKCNVNICTDCWNGIGCYKCEFC